ncbi:hypothetical protein [Actinomadura sp. 9N215]|uniref:hypothetical protein n=1 Tax=Actinomadura sp. 9N215 TaxID=3375150 RepID=UPI00378FBBA4
MDDGEGVAEQLRELRNIHLPGAGLEMVGIPERLASGVKLMEPSQQAHGVCRDVVERELLEQPGKLIRRRAQAMTLLALEVRVHLGGA